MVGRGGWAGSGRIESAGGTRKWQGCCSEHRLEQCVARAVQGGGAGKEAHGRVQRRGCGGQAGQRAALPWRRARTGQPRRLAGRQQCRSAARQRRLPCSSARRSSPAEAAPTRQRPHAAWDQTAEGARCWGAHAAAALMKSATSVRPAAAYRSATPPRTSSHPFSPTGWHRWAGRAVHRQGGRCTGRVGGAPARWAQALGSGEGAPSCPVPQARDAGAVQHPTAGKPQAQPASSPIDSLRNAHLLPPRSSASPLPPSAAASLQGGGGAGNGGQRGVHASRAGAGGDGAAAQTAASCTRLLHARPRSGAASNWSDHGCNNNRCMCKPTRLDRRLHPRHVAHLVLLVHRRPDLNGAARQRRRVAHAGKPVDKRPPGHAQRDAGLEGVRQGGV